MKFRFKKLITVLIITTLVVPTTFFSMPKKADAVGTGLLACAMTAIFGKAMDKIQNTVSGIMAVPVRDVGVQSNTSDIKQEVKSQTFKDCVLDAVVWDVANTLIKNITASTIEWINSGFDGSPSFVTDPEGFFTDVGDQIAGSWIEGLGPIGRILCSPFDLQIRLALGFGYMGKGDYYFTVGCRLSDVQKNIYNAFTGGQWGADGWQNWITISQPQNNGFGVYIRAENDMMMRASEKVGIQKTELGWGNGFRSFKKCRPNPYEPEEQICENTTPGAVIETQLNSVIGSGQRKLEVADEINEIADALLNQLMNKIFSSSGLIGTSRSGSSYNSGKSYLSGLMSTYESQVAQRDILPPKGMTCGQTYRYVELPNNAAGKSQFRVEKYDKMGWFKRTNGKIDVDADGNKICTLTKPGTSLNPPAECPYYTIMPKTADSPIGDNGIVTGIEISEFESQFNLGCSNLSTNSPTQDLVNSATGEPGWGLEKPATTEAQIKNLTINRPSSLFPEVCSLGKDDEWASADNGNNSVKKIYQKGYEVAGTPKGISGGTWTVELEKPAEIKYMSFTRGDLSKAGWSDGTCNLATGGDQITIKLLKEENGRVETIRDVLITYPPNYTQDGPTFFIGRTGVSLYESKITKFDDLKNVKFIKLISGAPGLLFTEFEAFGTDDENTSTPVTPPPTGNTQSIARITSSDINNLVLRQNTALKLTDRLTIASTEDLPLPMTIKVELTKRQVVPPTATTPATYSNVNVNLNTIFDQFKILRAIQPGQIDFGYFDKVVEYSDVENPPNTPSTIPDLPTNSNSFTADILETNPKQKINYLTFDLSTKNTLLSTDNGIYDLKITIMEKGASGVFVGQQNYSFSITSATGI